MSTLEPLIAAWDEGHREFAIALNGLNDEDLWKRAHPKLLSVGELAGHVAYWQAVWTLGDCTPDPDLTQMPLQSPLLNRAFRYYTGTVEEPVCLEIGTARVLEEISRVHEAANAAVRDKSLDEAYPGMWKTWGNLVQYQVFHVAYHTGQAYSVRHLLGHETEDN
jgi:hypothetical protein